MCVATATVAGRRGGGRENSLLYYKVGCPPYLLASSNDSPPHGVDARGGMKSVITRTNGVTVDWL